MYIQFHITEQISPLQSKINNVWEIFHISPFPPYSLAAPLPPPPSTPYNVIRNKTFPVLSQ